jgi:UDP-N-acetyl-D-glucosamine dehydrogenase
MSTTIATKVESLHERILGRRANVTIVGAGYVGLPLAVRCANVGHHVIVYDIDQRKIDSIIAGKSYIDDIRDDQLKNQGYPILCATSDPTVAMAEPDVIVICVPTPLNKTKDPDVSMVVDAATMVREHMPRQSEGCLVILESTVYPGFTREIMVPTLSAAPGGWPGRLFTAFSPERVDPGNRRFSVHNTPKVVGGLDADSTRLAAEFYGALVSEVVVVSSCDAAEMAKVVENTFRMVNIALANETAMECAKLGLDVWEVIGAAATKPFGFMPFWPGPGVGGHCIGLDPHYLAWKLRSLNYRSRFIELAEQINSSMPEHVVRLAIDALSRHSGKAISGAKVLVLGMAYKPDVSDIRESPALDVVRVLNSHGARIRFFDPHAPIVRLENGDNWQSVGDPVVEAKEADCVLIITDHRSLDYRAICEAATLVVDTRNATKGLREEFPNKIVVL